MSSSFQGALVDAVGEIVMGRGEMDIYTYVLRKRFSVQPQNASFTSIRMEQWLVLKQMHVPLLSTHFSPQHCCSSLFQLQIVKGREG